MIARAPGKVLLCGEYAVLEGAPAVIMAIQRHAIASLGAAPGHSAFLDEARREIVARYGASSDEADLAARVTVDSSELSSGGRKLGLGSSAAATVAAIACATAARAADPRWRDEVHALAHRAHARAQEPRGSRGSGADVAASVHGGVLEVRRTGDDLTPLAVRRLALPPVAIILLWTGQPADTAALVAQVRALRARDPAAHAGALEEMAAAAADLAAARDPAAAVAAVRRGGAALALLAERAGVPLMPAALPRVAALAEAHGGAAKPTGAGGGDLLAAVLPDRAAAAAFQKEAARTGMTQLTPSVCPDGVVLAKSSNPN